MLLIFTASQDVELLIRRFDDTDVIPINEPHSCGENIETLGAWLSRPIKPPYLLHGASAQSIRPDTLLQCFEIRQIDTCSSLQLWVPAD